MKRTIRKIQEFFGIYYSDCPVCEKEYKRMQDSYHTLGLITEARIGYVASRATCSYECGMKAKKLNKKKYGYETSGEVFNNLSGI